MLILNFIVDLMIGIWMGLELNTMWEVRKFKKELNATQTAQEVT